MTERSILFVPGDSAKKIARAADCRADAIVLDLEDSVAPSRKAEARTMVRAALDARAGSHHRYWVRINALDSGEALADLAAVVGGAPDIILLPKACGASDVIQLDHYLSALEVRDGVTPGGVKVVVVATETGAALFGLGSYTPACPRLAGLAWGAEDLASAVGAASNSDEQGRLTPLYEMARGLCLAAAAAASVDPIDTAFMDIRTA
jgi:citrate lyase subunit beta / citryl-CoA lyase